MRLAASTAAAAREVAESPSPGARYDAAIAAPVAAARYGLSVLASGTSSPPTRPAPHRRRRPRGDAPVRHDRAGDGGGAVVPDPL